MKSRFALGCLLLLAGVAVSAPASAQKFNFELDNYTAAVNGSTPNAEYLWAGNPNVTPQIVAVKTDRGTTYQANGCYYIPGRLNTARGEVILSEAPDSVVHKLLTSASIGQQHSHSGMAMWSSSIRHNTLEADQIDLDGLAFKATGSHSLRDGGPGLTTQTVEAALSWEEFNIKNAVVLDTLAATGYPDAVAQTVQRKAQAEAAASKMEAMRGYYRLYAFTNMAWKDPLTLATNDGSMCAGSIYYANALAGNAFWAPSAWVTRSADVRNDAAPVLYNAVIKEIENGTEWFEDIFLAVYDATRDASVRAKMANQVVNCMAFNDCSNTTARWKNGVGSGSSMSPDDLLNYASGLAFLSALAGADSGFIYNSVKPLAVQGDYYCCPGGNDRSKYVTCSYKDR